jgi:hypothetical protein
MRSSEALQVACLPVVVAMMKRLAPADFAAHCLPLLLPVLEALQGPALMLAVQHLEGLASLFEGWVGRGAGVSTVSGES